MASKRYGKERRVGQRRPWNPRPDFRVGFPKTYRGKIMLVAFLGTHTPLLGVALYLPLGSSVGLGAALRILALLVTVTLAGTADTLLAKADAAMYQAKREGRAWVLAD